METNYPTLRRPKRKLCYLTNKESASKQWEGTLTLEDIDRIFDDLDPSSHDNDDLLPPSTLLQTFDIETNQCKKEPSPVPLERHLTEKLPKCQMGPKGDVLQPATRSLSPKLDIDLDIPFKAHRPVKTSSPIEENMVVEELDNEKDRVVSPLLFACEDEGKEEAKTEPLLIQNPRCNGHVTEEDDSQLESPPSKIVLSKPKMSSHKNKAEGSCKESHPVKEKTPKKPPAPVLEGKIKTPRQENAGPPVLAVRQEPELADPKKKIENVHMQPSVESTRVGKDMPAFLKKLRDAGQSKPACSRKSPVKVPTPPPEPEDDFLILEDDRPLWFSIPSKTATSKKRRQSKTLINDKDSSTDNGAKNSPLETAQKPQDSEQTKSKLGSQTVNQKTKTVKGKNKINEVTEPENDEDELPSPEDLPAGDLMEQEKPNKKKQVKKVPSEENDKEEEQPEDGVSREMHKDKLTLKMEKKAQKSSDMKRSKSLKDGNENVKKSRATKLKGARKMMQVSDAAKETMSVESVKEQSESSEKHAEAENLDSLSDNEFMNSEAQTEKDLAGGKDKRNKLPLVSEGSSSEDQILGKRKRRQPGQWWLDNLITKETKVTDNQPTLKKLKQYSQEPSATVPSPVKAKKNRVLKKRNQTQLAPSPSHNTNKAKEKKTKQNKNRKTRGDTADKVFHTNKAEQFEEQEQQEVADQDLDDQSSPLDLTHRDHSHNSGQHVFQRVYHHVSHEKLSTPEPVSPRGPREQLRSEESERRRRKPPGNWWAVDNRSEDVESISSQPQKLQPKPRKERKKLSKQNRSQLGTPKNGKMASKPLGGSLVPLLKPKPLLTPKTVKRSLATFKDIFTTGTETPTVVSSKDAGRKNRRKVTAPPAEAVTATDCATFSKTATDIPSMDAGESLQDSTCQSEGRLKPLRSGLSSMIPLEHYEEDVDLILPPTRVHAALSLSDLCAPPLKPLVLQPQDKANLREWFKSLWPIPDDKSPDITPDHFDWYSYKGRAIGFLVDLNCGSFCSGKILLGSYMKKPLWVDHSATTAFNLLSSSVSVTINGKKSRFYPGPSFMVPCGKNIITYIKAKLKCLIVF
uniref:Mif2/CENP-C cupin domain-containing protein n=1 Tax=Sander lucioperca TaxID=283035 RepID=A0A8C9YXJ1_SANLU